MVRIAVIGLFSMYNEFCIFTVSESSQKVSSKQVENEETVSPKPLQGLSMRRSVTIEQPTSENAGNDVIAENSEIDIRKLLINHQKWPSNIALPTEVVQCWLAQLVTALAHLHAEGIIVR